MSHMVYQGTVLGLTLWRIFFADSCLAIGAEGFEVSFADDLNAFAEVDAELDDNVVFARAAACQRSLHSWGRANR
eukprot:2285880-Pyramimonas_sp.AAC.1